MKMTGFQTVVIAIFAILAIVGIFVFATYSGAGSKSKIGAVTIWGPFPSTDVNTVFASLSNTDSDFKDVKYVQEDPANFDSDYIKAAAAGNAPDLILISQEDLQQLKSTLSPIPYTSLSQRQFSDTFADGASIYMMPDGVYGIPVGIDPLVLYYNKSLLSSAGIAAPPTTWEQLTGLVPKVVQQAANQGIAQAFIAMGSYPNVHDARGILSALFFQAQVPITTVTSQGAVVGALGSNTGNNGVSPGQAAVNFYTSFANPSLVSYTWNSALPDSQQMFTSGKLALYIGYASELSFIKQANPNLQFDMARLPQPQNTASRVTYGKIYALAIPRNAKNQSGAFTIAVALSTENAETALLKAAGTIAPARRSLLAATPNDPDAAIYYDQAIVTRGWLSPATSVVDTIFGSMIQKVTTGQASLDAAVTNAEQSLTAAFNS